MTVRPRTWKIQQYRWFRTLNAVRNYANRSCSLSIFLCIGFINSLYLQGVELPPTDYEYSWIELQQINFLNQKLLTNVEENVGAQQWDKAEAMFREALRNDPNSNEIKGRLLTVLAESGKNREALSIAYPLLKQYPRHVSLVQFIGILEERSGNQEAANKAWTYLVALPESSDEALLYAAKSLYPSAVENRDRALALQLAEIWERLEPGYESSLQYASSLWKAGQRDEAIRILQRAVRIADANQKEESQFYLAYTLIHLNRGDEAAPHLEEIATRSNSPGARYRAAMQIAHLKQTQREMQAARRWLDTAAEDGEKDEVWRNLYAQTILDDGNVEATLAAVGEIFDADQATFLLLLSFQFLQKGYDGLAYYFIRNAENKPGLPEQREAEYWSNRAFMAERQNNFDDVLYSIELALEREPNRHDWHILRIRALFMLGETREALREARQLERTLLQQPASAENQQLLNETIDFIASSHLALEDYRETLRTARNSASVYTGSGLYRYQALAFYHIGDYDESETAFQSYFQRQPNPAPDGWGE